MGLGRRQLPGPEGEVLVAALEAVDHHGRVGAAEPLGAGAGGSGYSAALAEARLPGLSVTIPAPPPAAAPWARPSAVSSAPIGFASGASRRFCVTRVLREDAGGGA